MTWRNSLNGPIIGVVGFNLLTLFVFATAPVEWNTNNLVQLYFLVLSCQLLILVAFHLGRNKGLAANHPSESLLSSGDNVTNYVFALYLSTFVIAYAYRMGFPALDIAGMYSLLMEGVQDRRVGYQMALRGTGLGPIPWTVYFIVSISNQVFFIVAFLQWNKLRSIKKLLLVIFVCIELFFSIGRGTAFGVVSLATTFFLSSMFWVSNTKKRWISKVISSALLVLFLFLGSIAFFSHNLYSRSGNTERGVRFVEFGHSATIVDHVVFSLLPESLHPSYMNVVSYFGAGYYHASLAFDLDFESTWGLGNNPALIGLAAAFGVDVWDRTYIHRLEVTDGVDQFGVWHSAYTWFASDVSFYGVPVVLFLVAYLFGFSWAMSLRGDFLSKVVFVVLGNVLLFLFANNTYLSVVFYSFMFLLPFWMFTRFFGLARAAAVRRRRSTDNKASGPWRPGAMSGGAETLR